MATSQAIARSQFAYDHHVELIGIGKRFEGVEALHNANLTVERGTIHALVGENGAGKSTLGKIIAGVISPDRGQLKVGGRQVTYRSPRDAIVDGITMIAQEISLVPLRSVIENVFLGAESSRLRIVDRRDMRRRFSELRELVGFDLPGDALVGSLRIADQQKVEILRAIARHVQLIVMDEPTAALAADEAETLLEHIRRLKESGVTIIFVSHSLDQVLALADKITVLKDGMVIRTADAQGESPTSLVATMLGHSLDLAFPERQLPKEDAPVVLELDGITCGDAVRDVSLSVRAGEIVGLAGLVGSGRSEVARAAFGADRIDSGRVLVNGRRMDARSPRQAIRRGLAMVPESRKDQGLVMGLSITENCSLAHLKEVSRGSIVFRARERARTRELFDHLNIHAARFTMSVSQLSGGNQQKVVFAKWLFRTPEILIADEPTRGVDVGAKHAVYELIASLARQGMAVLLISSELEEVLGLAHRIVVMREGRAVAEFGHDACEADVMEAAFGTNRRDL